VWARSPCVGDNARFDQTSHANQFRAESDAENSGVHEVESTPVADRRLGRIKRYSVVGGYVNMNGPALPDPTKVDSQ